MPSSVPTVPPPLSEMDKAMLRDVGSLALFTHELFKGNPVRATSGLAVVLMEFIKTSDNPSVAYEKVVASMKLMLDTDNVFIGKHPR